MNRRGFFSLALGAAAAGALTKLVPPPLAVVSPDTVAVNTFVCRLPLRSVQLTRYTEIEVYDAGSRPAPKHIVQLLARSMRQFAHDCDRRRGSWRLV